MARYRKYISISFILAAGMFLAYGALAYLPFHIQDQESLWINNSMIKKESIAEGISQPKIVFLGGSATLYGVRTKDIQKEINLPVINLGVHAALQVDYILYRVKRSLKEGDTVILIPEYAHYLYDGWFTEVKINYIRNYDREYVGRLPWVEKFNYMYGTSFDAFLKAVRKQLVPNDGRVASAGGVYTVTTQNENGDETYNVSNDKTREKLLTSNPLEINWGVFTETLGLRAIKDFSKWCELNDVEFYVAYPPTIYSKEYENEAYKNYFDMLQKYFAENGIQTIGAPYDSFYDISMFYDSRYHLNNEGMDLNTRRLIDELKELDIFPAERPH